jgi:hypothetical protein
MEKISKSWGNLLVHKRERHAVGAKSTETVKFLEANH